MLGSSPAQRAASGRGANTLGRDELVHSDRLIYGGSSDFSWLLRGEL